MNWIVLIPPIGVFLFLLYLLFRGGFKSAEADDFLQKHYDDDYK